MIYKNNNKETTVIGMVQTRGSSNAEAIKVFVHREIEEILEDDDDFIQEQNIEDNSDIEAILIEESEEYESDDQINILNRSKYKSFDEGCPC